MCAVYGSTHLCCTRRWIGKVWPVGGEGEWGATRLAGENSISDSEKGKCKGRRVPAVSRNSEEACAEGGAVSDTKSYWTSQAMVKNLCFTLSAMGSY